MPPPIARSLPDASKPTRQGAGDVGPSDHERYPVLAELARHAVAAREEERRRLAAELHDVASTNLAAIKLNLSSLAHAIPAGASQEARWLADTQALLTETIVGMRELCSALRPAVLDHASLPAALDAHCSRYSRRTGIEVDLDMTQYDARCGPETELMLLRVAQEALWNSAKHARARRVRVVYQIVDGRGRFSIRDDGQGFDPDQLRSADSEAGIGILNMRERALSVGADFTLESSPAGGTSITLDL